MLETLEIVIRFQEIVLCKFAQLALMELNTVFRKSGNPYIFNHGTKSVIISDLHIIINISALAQTL